MSFCNVMLNSYDYIYNQIEGSTYIYLYLMLFWANDEIRRFCISSEFKKKPRRQGTEMPTGVFF